MGSPVSFLIFYEISSRVGWRGPIYLQWHIVVRTAIKLMPVKSMSSCSLVLRECAICRTHGAIFRSFEPSIVMGAEMRLFQEHIPIPPAHQRRHHYYNVLCWSNNTASNLSHNKSFLFYSTFFHYGRWRFCYNTYSN